MKEGIQLPVFPTVLFWERDAGQHHFVSKIYSHKKLYEGFCVS